MAKPDSLTQSSPLSSLSRAVYHKPTAFLRLLLGLSRNESQTRIINRPNYPPQVIGRDLDEKLSFFKECVSDKYETPVVLAHLFERSTSTTHRKLRGQYFTSRSIAQLAANLLAPSRDGWLIDAGCGAGIFASAILKEPKGEGLSLRYLGIEVDPILTLCSATTLDLIGAPKSWKVLFGNYLSLDQEYLRKIGVSGISGIISNPPYVRFHRIRHKKNLIATMKRRTGITLSGFSGLHSFFLAQSSALLGVDGRMVFVLPPEMDLINHGSSVLEQLSPRFVLKKYPGEEDLTVFSFQGRTAANLTRSESVGTRVARLQLKDVANVRRGISTGANGYFALTEQMVQKWGIAEKWRTKIIPTKIPLPEQVFGERDWNNLREKGKPCWLLKIPRESKFEELPESLKDYIRFGEKDQINLRPTCKFRDPWYSVPISPAPDMIFTYMSRERPRFIYNQARALVLTNLLGLFLKTQNTGVEAVMRLCRLMTKNLVAWIEETGAGRRYAGGLTKFEPGDLRNMPISSEVLAVVAPANL